jgi:hypothetical protein
LADTPPWDPKRRTNSPIGDSPPGFSAPCAMGFVAGAAAGSRVVGEGRVGNVQFY